MNKNIRSSAATRIHTIESQNILRKGGGRTFGGENILNIIK